MKSVFKFLAIFLSILVLSVVLTPILYDLMPSFKFGRIFNRVVMILTLVAVALFVKIKKETFAAYKMDWQKQSLVFFLKGFGIAIVTLLIFSAVSLLGVNSQIALRDLPYLEWARKLVGCFLAAVLIGTIEEFFFRGFVFTGLRDKLFRGGTALAMIATSLFYSSLHFVSVKKPEISTSPGIADSLKLVLAPIQSFAEWQSVWPAFVGLFLFGLALNFALTRSRSLWTSIGLHAGCVFFIKSAGLFMRFSNDNVFFWATKKVYDGVVGWIFLMLILVFIAKVFKKTLTETGDRKIL